MIYSNDFTNRFIYGTTVDRNWSNYVHFRLDYSRDSYREGESAVIWMIASPGPDMDRDHGSDNNAEGSTSYPIHYDATNGTVSNGDLFMFGPGVGFAEDR
jgi:hypothetical protein